MRVNGEGNPKATVFCCAEAPGEAEDQKGRPMIGKTGREYDRYLLMAARIPRQKVWTTNLVRERPFTRKVRGNSPPTAEDIKRDEPDLVRELLRVKPKWIACIGRYSLQWFLHKDATIGDCHGFAYPIPQKTVDRIVSIAGLQKAPEWLGSTVVVSLHHPAAGLHSSNIQKDIQQDFIRLGQYVRGELDPTPPVDQFPDPDYYEIRQPVPLLSPRDCAVDTESKLDGSNIWGGSYSFHPGSGAVIRAGNRKLLNSFRDNLLYVHRIALHNAPHDLRVIAKWLNVSIYELCSKMRFECTMQMAFVYRLLPLALKSIGKRFFGMSTTEYRELVGPADVEKGTGFLLRVLENQCSTCGGSGQVVAADRYHKTSKKLLESRVENCPDCEGDGTGWEPPEQQLKWDNKKKKMSISRGQRMGVRVRKVLEKVDDIDVSADASDPYSQQEMDEGDDKQPAGLQKWWRSQVKYEFRMQVERELGPIPEATLHDVDQKVATDYAAKDADMTIRFLPYVEKLLRDEGLWDVYETDRRAMPMVCQMMEVGWKIDVPYLQELSNQLSGQMDVKLYELERLVGHYVSPSSPVQVAELLFGELGLEPVVITESGLPSTKDDVLGDLELQAAGLMDGSKRHRTAFQSLGLIRDHRELSKLRSTYTIKLPRMVDKDGRVHTELKMAVTESRRLASRNPNLQNIPRRSENGRLVRHAFTCEPGNVLVAADYSQIEFRILAHESGEKQLIKAINDGLDPHALTTSKIFGIPLSKVDRDSWQRQVSKMISFLILYGGSALLLKAKLKTEAQMDIPVEKCQQWIDDYTSAKGYAAIGEYIQDSAAMARRYGYVSDCWGHRRYLPGVYSELYGVRAEAERIAVNHRIQGANAGATKAAMALIWDDVLPKFRKRGYCEPLMQIHDDITIEVERELADKLKIEVIEAMGSVMKLSVPIIAEGKVGVRWNELE